ncbi:MAG: transcriptional regulator [Comamonadaceae bacterium]|nr:MAG: transcriptional regulator [Comamonadaceae bacterium]
MSEKQEFSDRLRKAMQDCRLAPSASVLEREFNLRWSGNPIRRQAAWKWLNGEAIPTQDKLQEIARWLRVEPHQLRFGDATLRHLRVEQKRWDEGAGYLERETFDAFLRLPAAQRKLVREVILTFAQVYATPDGSTPRE